MRAEIVYAILALMASACGDFTGSNITNQQYETSPCGGFSTTQGFRSDRAYCDAEVLRFQYDASRGRLELTDSRVLLNCCGLRSFGLSQVGDVFVATETDLPDFDQTDSVEGRCRCNCAIDFRLRAEAIPSGVLPFRLDRAIFEQGETHVIYQGELDLSAGTGEIVIDDQPIDVDQCPI